MTILAIDDERLVLTNLTGQLHEAEPDATVEGFTDPALALQFVREHPVDLAFLDVEMDEIDGITLAEELIQLQPQCRILFITGYPQYAADAYRLHACGYVLKPTSVSGLKEEIDRLRNPLPPLGKRTVRVHTFGSFEVFTAEGPVSFGRAKAKELLAYLIDRRGAGCTSKEIASILWEDKPYGRSQKNYVQNVIGDLSASLKKAGAQQILIRKWNSLAVDVHQIDCDYYAYLDGDASTKSAFQGEYMSNYSWAEETAAYLSRYRDTDSH